MPPDEPTDEERLEELPEDNQTPFRPAEPADSGTQKELDSTHPATDGGIEPEEAYDEGIAGAAEVDDPTANNDVLGYTKPAREDSNDKGKGGDHGNN